MADLFLTIAFAAWLLFVFSIWQVARLLGGWQPAQAHVWRSDYTLEHQSADFWSLGLSGLTTRGWRWDDGENARLIEDEIVYTTRDGRERRALVSRRVARGRMPSGYYTVWYDPADPDQVTAIGPWHWGGTALVALALLAACGSVIAQTGLPPAVAALIR